MQDIEESLSIRGRRSEKEQNVKAKKNAREGGEKKKKRIGGNMGSKGMKREGSIACMLSFFL